MSFGTSGDVAGTSDAMVAYYGGIEHDQGGQLSLNQLTFFDSSPVSIPLLLYDKAQSEGCQLIDACYSTKL